MECRWSSQPLFSSRFCTRLSATLKLAVQQNNSTYLQYHQGTEATVWNKHIRNNKRHDVSEASQLALQQSGRSRNVLLWSVREIEKDQQKHVSSDAALPFYVLLIVYLPETFKQSRIPCVQNLSQDTVRPAEDVYSMRPALFWNPIPVKHDGASTSGKVTHLSHYIAQLRVDCEVHLYMSSQ
jgi:hypothetical protein